MSVASVDLNEELKSRRWSRRDRRQPLQVCEGHDGWLILCDDEFLASPGIPETLGRELAHFYEVQAERKIALEERRVVRELVAAHARVP